MTEHKRVHIDFIQGVVPTPLRPAEGNVPLQPAKGKVLEPWLAALLDLLKKTKDPTWAMALLMNGVMKQNEAEIHKLAELEEKLSDIMNAINELEGDFNACHGKDFIDEKLFDKIKADIEKLLGLIGGLGDGFDASTKKALADALDQITGGGNINNVAQNWLEDWHNADNASDNSGPAFVIQGILRGFNTMGQTVGSVSAQTQAKVGMKTEFEKQYTSILGDIFKQTEDLEKSANSRGIAR